MLKFNHDVIICTKFTQGLFLCLSIFVQALGAVRIDMSSFRCHMVVYFSYLGFLCLSWALSIWFVSPVALGWKDRPQNNLLCVEWNVTLSQHNSSEKCHLTSMARTNPLWEHSALGHF